MRWKLCLLAAVFLLTACSIEAPAPPTIPAAVLDSATAEPTVPPTATESPTSTITSLPSDTPIPSSTPEPSPTASPTIDPCWEAGGRVTHHTLSTELSPWPWEFRVYTPPCYDEQPDRVYPLLILIHGSTYTDSQWDDLGADEQADALILNGEAPPFIILMPRDRVWVEPNEDPFGDAVMEYILPWVDANYRTIQERSYRAIGGLSRGASWAVHLGLKYWDQFSAIGAHSLPVFLTDPPKIQAWLEEIPADQLPRIYIDIGDKDYLLNYATWFENLLTERNIPHEWYLNIGRHEDAYWMTHLKEYLIWYTAGW